MSTYNIGDAVVISFSGMLTTYTVEVQLWLTDGSYLAAVPINISKSGISAGADWRGLLSAALNDFCDSVDASHPLNLWTGFDGEIVPASRTTGFATVATTGSYNDLTNKPTIPTSAYSSYQAMVSQTGTSAPSATSLVNSLGVTFTWARTSAGVYTITASTAVFTAGKTGIFVKPLNNLNGAISTIVTSTTVITVTTAVQSLAVLGLLGFTATPTDALLVSTLFEVRVYP